MCEINKFDPEVMCNKKGDIDIDFMTGMGPDDVISASVCEGCLKTLFRKLKEAGHDFVIGAYETEDKDNVTGGPSGHC